MPRPTTKTTFSLHWDCLRDISEWPVSTEAGMKGLERSGNSYTVLQPTATLPAWQTRAEMVLHSGDFCCWAWRDFQPVWMISTYILMSQHQQWAGRESLLSLAGGLCAGWNARSSAAPAACSHQPAPALPCLGHTGTAGASSGHSGGQIYLSHRPLHCFWAHTYSCVYLSECSVQDVNHRHKITHFVFNSPPSDWNTGPS